MEETPRRLIEVEDAGDTTIVRFIDRKILDEKLVKSVGEQLLGLVENLGRHNVILTFENVDYLASSLVGKFLALNKKLQSVGGKLTLRNINPQIYAIFEVSRLDKLLNIERNPSQAPG